MIKKNKVKKLKKKTEKFLKTLTEHVFGSFMVLVFIFLILGGIIFYRYSFLIEKMEPVSSQAFVQYEENVFREVSNQWLEREEKFKQAETKQYPDLFNLTQ